jgi:AGCS family alanine or glycine:cation symporter
MSLDQQIDRLIKPLAEGLSDIVFYQISVFGQGFPLIVLWLVTAAVFFTGYLGFINIRGFSRAISLVSDTSGKTSGPGEISHFQALSTAISGTVGVGNIGGVAWRFPLAVQVPLFGCLWLVFWACRPSLLNVRWVLSIDV